MKWECQRGAKTREVTEIMSVKDGMRMSGKKRKEKELIKR